MNKFKKSSKSKSLTLGIAILSSAAIVSTGFAAWVITGGAEASVSGIIEADTIVNHEHSIAFASGVNQSNLGKIFFGTPKKPLTETTYHWLETGDTETEKLSIETTFTVDNVADIELDNTEEKIKNIIDIENTTSRTRFEEGESSEGGTKYSTLAGPDKKYLADLPAIKLGGEATSVGVHITFDKKDVSHDIANNIATFNLKIVFGWGSAFRNDSPYVYYNNNPKNGLVSGTSGTTWKQDAEAKLGEIAELKANFKLTLVTK